MPFARYFCIFINVGLGEGSALPVGVPVPWPSATPPTGWLKCNGAAFSAEKYPELAKAYPTNKLPDLRGEFIRGWDDGRGVDSGRGLLSLQSSQNLSHSHDDLGAMGGNAVGVPGITSVYAKKYYGSNEGYQTRPAGGWSGSASGLTSLESGGNESRPRNVAFNYIVRAA
ncbi:TPA: tail fiber protein [Escherichia coli]|nr:phage tail protein [Escherichia coli]EFN7897630.1 phage tail protein [Escherichia coli]ELO2889085.1 tail fiber protein [Escherichia coli]HAH9203864.1 phage tail protein [Escherichia coli]HBC7762736.1 tail fiber protein [Escherichia coli]